MTFSAPIREILFTLEHVCNLQHLRDRNKFDDLSPDLVSAILQEAAKFTENELAPLNRTGDLHGATLQDGIVRTAPGFKQAYAKFVEGGWQGLSFPEADGGMGLPGVLGIACMEMLQSANMAFGLGPMLTMGAIEVLVQAGTPEQKTNWLPRLISGEWTASMNLTEPAAGSDVGAIRTTASAQADGSFLLKGQKIFITWGEHDCTDNIVHLVLARTDGAQAGTKGLSLFLVPKYLPDENGAHSIRNDVFAIGLEHKLGIHGSPTCVMEYGGNKGAKGWLVGEEMRGMAMMFIMMNSARLNVGVQGVGIAERAWQQAFSYAKDRKQGRAVGHVAYPASIIQHPDVRRMLMDAKAKIAAARAICYACAMAADLAVHGADEEQRTAAKRREDLLTPLSKSYGTDVGCEVASMGVQVHGGMGFIEETGAAQHFRDARIAPIYEGTNGIQAIDFAGRKLSMAGGLLFSEMIVEMRQTITECEKVGKPEFEVMAALLHRAVDEMETTSSWMADPKREAADALCGATAFQDLCAQTIGGHFLVKGAMAAEQLILKDGPSEFLQGRIDLASYYCKSVLAEIPALAEKTRVGNHAVFAMQTDTLAP